MVDPKSGKYDLLPHVAPGNIESFTGRLYDNVKLVGEENLISGKFVFNVGDIVYGKINPQLGKYVFARFSGLTSADAYVLNAKNGIVQKFLYAVIQTRDFYDYSVSVSKRSGMPKINRDELNAYSYWAPSESEQLKIGEYLLTLDHIITLHQRQPFLHSPPDISLIVQLTPPFYTFSWEQRKLGDVGETYTGLSGKTKADFGHGQARFVTYMNVFSNPISNPEMTEPIEIDPKQNEVEVGDVFFTTSSETPEEVGMSSVLLEKRGKIYLNSFCFGFRPTEKIDSYYLAYMLRSESAREKIILLAQGISRYNISKNKVMEIAVSLPSLDEQKLIGQYFRQLDNLITLHQRQTIVYAVIRSIRKVILAERQYFAPPMVRKSP